jgi:hypothetical protein
MKIHTALFSLIAACALCSASRGAGRHDDSEAPANDITDTDLDGIIDFDLVVGGVFRAKGRVFESFGTITKTVTLTSTPPDTEAVFGKLGVGAGTAAFTVTVNTTAFTATGPPLGWTVSYVGSAEDAMAGIVEIPTHFVDASVNAGTIPLTMVNGVPILATMNTPIDLFASGVNAGDSATDVRVVFSFTPGPDDEILLPDNNGLDDKSIEVNVFNQSDACIDRMNNDARRVALLAQKSDFKCVKKGSGNVTACVDDPVEPKTDGKEQKLIADFADRCDPVPAWGVNGATCCEGGANDGGLCLMPAACPGGSCVGGACISAAAETGAGAITHDLFGATVNVASDRDAANCQAAVSQRAGKLTPPLEGVPQVQEGQLHADFRRPHADQRVPRPAPERRTRRGCQGARSALGQGPDEVHRSGCHARRGSVRGCVQRRRRWSVRRLRLGPRLLSLL